MIENYWVKKKNRELAKQAKVEVVAVRKENGVITDLKLSDGRILSKEEAIQVAKTEGIVGVNVGVTRGEERIEILRVNPINDVEKALYNLPTFE